MIAGRKTIVGLCFSLCGKVTNGTRRSMSLRMFDYWSLEMVAHA